MKLNNVMKKIWSMPILDFSNLLRSRVVLYFVFFVALVNVFTMTTLGDWPFATVFFLVGFLTSFFSKNMIVILFFALTVTNVLKYGSGTTLYGSGVNLNGSGTTLFNTNLGTSSFSEGMTAENKPEDIVAPLKTESGAAQASTTASTTVQAPASESGQLLTKEEVNSRKELLKMQREILDKLQEMEPFLNKVEGLTAKMSVQK